METVSQMLGSAGDCPEFGHGGKTWKVGHPDQATRKRLEKLAAKVALDEVRRLKDVLDPTAYQETFAEVTRSLPDYRTWGPGWLRVVFDPAHHHLFLLALLQGPQPWATEADAVTLARECPEEVKAALVQVIPDFFTVLLAGLLDRLPPGERAEKEAAVAALRAEFLARLTPTPGTPLPPSGTPT